MLTRDAGHALSEETSPENMYLVKKCKVKASIGGKKNVIFGIKAVDYVALIESNR